MTPRLRHLYSILACAVLLWGCTDDEGITDTGADSDDIDTTVVFWDTSLACAPPADVGAAAAQPSPPLTPTATVMSTADSGDGTLRTALAAASDSAVIAFDSSLAGATISLRSSLTLDGAIRIDATTAPGLTIDGRGTVRVFSVAAQSRAAFVGLRIARGHAVGGDNTPGGAISTGNHCTLHVQRCVFIGNAADIGGAIRAGYGTYTTIEDCDFAANDGSGARNGFSAGAIATNGHGELIVRRCLFVRNRGHSGGAVYNLLQPITVESCVFVENRSSGPGAAVFTDEGNWVGPNATVGGRIIVRDCWMQDNEAHELGGALFLWANKLDTVVVERCVLRGNSVARGGTWNDAKGGALRTRGILTIRDCAFIENRAEQQGGGAWLDGAGPFRIVNTTFYGNTVTDDMGGALTLNVYGPVDIVNCTIARNHAGRACGAFWLRSADLEVTLANSIVADNTAGSDHAQDQIGYQPIDGGGNIEFPAPVGSGRRVAENGIVADPSLRALSRDGDMLVAPLAAGSPAVGIADPAQAPAADARGAPRDLSPDAGAVEYVTGDAGLPACAD